MKTVQHSFTKREVKVVKTRTEAQSFIVDCRKGEDWSYEVCNAAPAILEGFEYDLLKYMLNNECSVEPNKLGTFGVDDRTIRRTLTKWGAVKSGGKKSNWTLTRKNIESLLEFGFPDRTLDSSNFTNRKGIEVHE
jgi:hypothetical protein